MQTARPRKVDESTTIIPDEFFSPLSYSLSLSSQQNREMQQRTKTPPPPPSAQRQEWNKMLSFSQDYTPKSLLAAGERHSNNIENGSAEMKRDVHDLLAYVDTMAFSPGAQTAPSNVDPRIVPPAASPLIGLPPRSANRKLDVLRNRNPNIVKAPYPERTPGKPMKPMKQAIEPPAHKHPVDALATEDILSTSRYYLDGLDEQPSRSANDLSRMATPSESATLQATEQNGSTNGGNQLEQERSRIEKEQKWNRIEEFAAKVRNGLDPEPTLERTLADSESIILGTAFADSRLISRIDDDEEDEHILTEDVSTSKQSRCVSPERNESSAARFTSSLGIDTEVVETQEKQFGEEDFLNIKAPKTPEDAHKLLKTAVSALQDARAEREAARQWAQSMKDAVSNWVDEQRKLVESEATSAANLDGLTYALQNLQKDIQSSNQHREATEKNLHQLLLEQQEKIQALSQQLASMEQAMSEASRTGAGSRRTSPPKFVDKTPTTAKSGSSSQMSSSSSRVRRRTKEGGHVVVYGNGVQKEVHKDGTTVVRFVNGDVETTFAESGTVAYFHAEDKVMQITQADGSTLFEYPNRQIERHYNNGLKAIIFPDGTKQTISPSGRTQTFF